MKRLPHERPLQRGISPPIGLAIIVGVIVAIILVLSYTDILVPEVKERPHITTQPR